MPIPVPLPTRQFCAEELYIADLMMIELNVPTARIQPVYRVVVVLTVDVKIVMLSDFNQGVAGATEQWGVQIFVPLPLLLMKAHQLFLMIIIIPLQYEPIR